MAFKLTEPQKNVVRWIVEDIRNGYLAEEFNVQWYMGGFDVVCMYDEVKQGSSWDEPPELTPHILNVLEKAGMIHCEPHMSWSSSKQNPRQYESSRTCMLLADAYDAVDSDFDAPDTSFVRHLSPLDDVTELDEALKQRCLPVLGAGGEDPITWDSATRTAGVILEERLRQIGGLQDEHLTGVDLVNRLFGKSGTFSEVLEPAELQSHRDLYAGVVGVFRNRSAHRLVDPSPMDGGAYIVFVDLLLRMASDIQARLDTEIDS